MKVTIQYYEDEGFARIFVDGNYVADIVRDPNIIERGIKFSQLKSILVMLDKRTNTDSWDDADFGMELEYKVESKHITEV